MSKKEGNITIANTVNNITNPIKRQAQAPINKQAQAPHNSCNPTLATALLPPGERSNSPLATVHPSSEGNSSPNNQINNISNSVNRQAHSANPTPAIAHLPPGEGSNSLLGAVHLPSEDASSSQQIVFTPAREENSTSQGTSLPISSSPQSSRSSQSGQGNNPPG